MRRYFLLFILLLTACGTPGTVAPPETAPTAAPSTAAAANDPCADAALQAYRRSYNETVDRWGEAAIRAGNTQPADLKPAIESLQKVVDDLAALTPPACAQQAHSASLEAMRQTITGYENLLAQKDVGTTIRNGIDSLADARLHVNALPGQPAPTPTALPTDTPAPTYTPVPTFTPTPTSTPTSTPEPTATPLPRKGTLASRQQVFETATSDVPVKTLAKGTAILVFEALKGRIHIRAGDIEGWVSSGAVVID